MHVGGKVLGFRQWTLDGYKLRSAAVAAHWTIGENKARCLISRSAHESPQPWCECGLYAWHQPVAAYRETCMIFGAVLAWGRIEVHAHGFRAEYAEPVILAYSREQPYGLVEDARTIAGEMGIPLVEISGLEESARQLGSPIARELRPPVPPVPRLPSGVHFSGGASVATMQPMAVATGLPGPFQPVSSRQIVLIPPPPRRRSRVARLGIAANLAVAGTNIGSGILTGRPVNFASAAFSLSVAAIVARLSKRP